LKSEHVAKRLKWATVHKDWTAEDFEGVICSDECSNVPQVDLRHQGVARQHLCGMIWGITIVVMMATRQRKVAK
ncbi:hypothetical protein L873DRAFT_1879721, partial [Choiromyces venosus 120613-1]